jgi:hypothetical protein
VVSARQRGDFVPGSGRLHAGVLGKEESIAPIFNSDNGPDLDEPKNETEARRIRLQWLEEEKEID